MEQTGRVIAVEPGFATVEIKRMSACDSCHKSESGCAVCSLLSTGSKHTAKVIDPIGVSVGDRVLLVADDLRVLAYSAAVFLLPLAASATAYAAAAIFTENALWRFAVAALSFIAFYALLYFTLNKSESKKPAVRIERVLDSDDAEPRSE